MEFALRFDVIGRISFWSCVTKTKLQVLWGLVIWGAITTRSGIWFVCTTVHPY